MEEVIKHLSQKETKHAAKTKPDFFIYGKEHVAKLEASGNIGNSISYSCALSKLKSYVKKDELTFEEVTYSFIERGGGKHF